MLHWQVGSGAVLGLLVCCVLLVGLGIAAFGALSYWRAEHYLSGALNTAFDGKGALDRFPRTDRNPTAVRLHELARDVGINLAHSSEDADSTLDEGLDESLGDYFHEIIVSEAMALPEPPAIAVEWLDGHRGELTRIVSLLIEEEPPVEPVDLALGYEAPLPKLISYLHLERRLLFLAMDAIESGDRAAAVSTLEAAWRLGEPMWDRPTLISQLVAASIARAQMAVVRRHPEMALDWSRRLEEIDPTGGAFRGFLLEAWVPWHDREIASMSSSPAWVWRWMLFDYAHRTLLGVEEMRTRDILEFRPDEFFARHYGDLPRWNFIGRILLPNLYDAWPRAHRTALDLELTRLLVDACAYPDALAYEAERREPSFVDGLSWIIRLDGDRMTVSLDGEIDVHQREKRPDLPLHGALDLGRCRVRQV